MGNYSDAQRAKMPASAFCGPDRSFPVLDADDARKALRALGRAAESDRGAIRSCVMGRAKKHGWKVGDNADMAAFDAQFNADPMGEGEDTVLRTGPIFECGAYPDKQFSLTPEEADAAIAAFTPVEADYEHIAGPLDGQLGQLLTVWRDGTTLYGTAAVPRWVDTVLATAGHKLSLAWDRASKQIVGWAWVTEPRVSHATLQSAFAAFAGSRHSAGDQAMLDSACTLLVRAGANPPAHSMAGGMARYHKENRMSRFDEFMAWLKGDETEMPAPLTPSVPAPSAQFSAQEAALAEERRKLDAERAQFARDRYWAQAETDVARLITEGRVLPAENLPTADGKPALTALFAQALADDATGAALFGQAQGSRYGALLAVYSARTPHSLTKEVGDVRVLDAAPPASTEDKQARMARLRALAGK